MLNINEFKRLKICLHSLLKYKESEKMQFFFCFLKNYLWIFLKINGTLLDISEHALKVSKCSVDLPRCFDGILYEYFYSDKKVFSIFRNKFALCVFNIFNASHCAIYLLKTTNFINFLNCFYYSLVA